MGSTAANRNLRHISLYHTVTCGLPKRYIILGLTWLGMVAVHSMRSNLSVTALTALHHRSLDNASQLKDYHTYHNVTGVTHIPRNGWDNKMVAMLRALFYLGLMLTQIPGAYLTIKTPSHYIFGSGVFISSLMNLCYPTTLAANQYVITCLIRFLQGICEGMLFPCMFAILWHWAPLHERSRLGTLVVSGTYIGAVIGFPTSGVIMRDYGWQYTYYIFSVVTWLWMLLWVIFSYDKPETHPHLTEKEMVVLEEVSKHTISITEKVPWWDILTSKHCWVLFLCNFAFNLLYTNEPSYITIYGYEFEAVGFFAIFPNACLALLAILSGFFADLLQRDPLLNLTVIRKLFTGIGFSVEAFCFLCLTFIRNGEIALIFLTIGLGFSGFTIAGWQINHLDLSPRYATIIVGFSNMFGILASLMSPIGVAYFTDETYFNKWLVAFGCFSATVSLAALFYCVFASAEVQPWGEWKGNTDGEELLLKLEGDADPDFYYHSFITRPAHLKQQQQEAQPKRSYRHSDWKVLTESESEDDVFVKSAPIEEFDSNY